eukprot:1190297-Prorocentrum_minimum.AAC.1
MSCHSYYHSSPHTCLIKGAVSVGTPNMRTLRCCRSYHRNRNERIPFRCFDSEDGVSFGSEGGDKSAEGDATPNKPFAMAAVRAVGANRFDQHGRCGGHGRTCDLGDAGPVTLVTRGL